MNSSLFKKALPHLIAIVIFLVVAIVYCKPALEGKVVAQSDMLGYKGMVQQSIEYKEKHGHFPLWTESMFSGMPAYNIAMEPKSVRVSIMNLSNVLTLWLPQPVSFFFLACICFYILTMVFGVRPWIGVLTALAYAYSSYDPVIIATGHVTKMLAIGYAPAVIASLILLYRGKYLWGTALLTLFFSFQAGTQHLQIIYYTLLIAGLLTLVYGIYSWQQKQLKTVAIGIVLAAIAGLIGFGTCAVSMLPVQEYAKETMRGGRSELTNATSKLESKNGLSKDYAFQWSYGVGETLTLAVPDAFGGASGGKEIGENSKFAEKLAEAFSIPQDQALQYTNTYWGDQPFTSGPVYVGAVVCLLFLLGLVYTKGWPKWWLVSVVIAGILLSWGKHFAGLNNFLFDFLPFYNKFRAPAMALVMVQFAFPLLGAIGLEELLSGKESKEALWKKFKNTAYISGGLVAVLVIFYVMAAYKGGNDTELKTNFINAKMQQLAQGKQPAPEMQQQAAEVGNSLVKALQADRQSLYGGDLLRTFLLIAVALGLIGLYIKDKLNQGILLGGLILLSSYDLLAVGKRYLSEDNFVDPSDFESRLAPTAADLQIKNDPDKNFRVFDQTGDPFQDSRTSYHHNSVGGYHPAKLGLYQDIIENQLSKGNMRVFNMLNTRYFIQPNPSTRQPEARLNAGAFGPTWLVKAIHYVKDGNEEMKALDSINTRDNAIIQQRYASRIPFQPEPDTTASIKLIENLNDKIIYKYSSKRNQFAVFSEVYYDKGWNVFLDGKKADYVRVDYILRGMPLPAGDHTIEFRFEPHSYEVGNTIAVLSSVLALLLLLAAIFVEWKKRSKQS